MTRTASSAMKVSTLHWTTLYAPIAAELEEAETIFRRELRCAEPTVDPLIKRTYTLGGKRLRPALLLLVAKAAGNVKDEHLVLAAVVEMIHTATLVHDDILDEATLRRHRATINADCGNEASVLVGDFLFTHAFSLASSLPTTFAARTIGQSTNIVCAGELRQIHHRGNFTLSEQEYLEIIDAKTAELCACCCRLGAHYAGASAAVEEAMTRYGRKLGLAFQIADDLLDLLGDEGRVGKSLGTDLRQQKLTLPLIRLLEQASAAERTRLVAALKQSGAHAREILTDGLAGSEAVDYARNRAELFAREARDELRWLPSGEAQELLAVMTELAINRRE